MKRQLLILSLLCLIISCKKNEKHKVEVNNNEVPKNKFESDIFSFNFPKDWKITDNEKIEEGIYYLAVEKNGFDSSGLMTIISFKELIDLDEAININIEEFKNNSMVNNLNIDAIKDSKFNGITARSLSFEFETLGIRHDGVLYAFSSNNNSIVILSQEALEDKKANSNGFDIIEKSFEIR